MAVEDDVNASNINDFTCGGSNLEIDDSYESQLCIPQDAIGDVLEWFPSFTSDPISLVDLFSTLEKEHTKSNDYGKEIENLYYLQKREKADLSVLEDNSFEDNSKKHSLGLDAFHITRRQRGKRVSAKQPCAWSKGVGIIQKKASIEKCKLLEDDSSSNEGEKRKCSHCQSEETPQWRIGPLGPKTLCNACGVRYKSGKLLPEYRPAASPTFNIFLHSNFHKKILKRKGLID